MSEQRGRCGRRLRCTRPRPTLSVPFSSLTRVPWTFAPVATALCVALLAAAPAGADESPLPQPTTTTPTPVAAAVPVSTPVPVAAPVPVETPDTLPPAITVVQVRHRLTPARRHGLRVTYSVTEAVLLRADLLLATETTDRALRMAALPGAGPGDSLAKATIARTPTGEHVVRVMFNAPARRALRPFLKVTLILRLIASDAAGNETVTLRPVTLKDF